MKIRITFISRLQRKHVISVTDLEMLVILGPPHCFECSRAAILPVLHRTSSSITSNAPLSSVNDVLSEDIRVFQVSNC